MKKSFHSASLWKGAALVGLALILCAEVVDRIVAVVGDVVITEQELNTVYATDELGLMTPDPLSGESARKLTREQYLDEMVKHKVIEQEVKKQGIHVDALEVEKAIDRKRESLGLSEQDFERALLLQGITMDQYRNEVKDQLITFRLISQEVRSEIEVTDEEIQSYYTQHPERFTEKDTLHLRHIFIPFISYGSTAEAGAVKRLTGVRAQIAAGADFQEMARKYSKSPTASSGGDLGWFVITELLPEFRDQVSKLQPGEMSPVFVQGKGAHLILLEETKKGQLVPLDKVKDQIHDIIFQQEAMERYDLWLERLKARTYIENRLANPGVSPYPNP
ncbi:MAG TPA: peptidylprolyl isomerase [bacterium]|nr:peptidylprolyl isomerase [bacterium]